MTAHSSPSRRIADDLQEEIKAGRLRPGWRLPAVRELAMRYEVSRATASKAISLLKARGLIVTRHGSGAFVRSLHPIRRLGPDRYARSRWQETTVQAYGTTDLQGTVQQGGQSQTVDQVPADDAVAAALGVEPGTLVYQRARLVTRDGQPTHTMTSYYRVEDVEGTALVDDRPGIAGPRGGFAVLTDRGLPPARIGEEIAARMPTPEEADKLQLGDGVPVVEVHRTTRTAAGRVVEFARGVHDASRFLWAYDYDIPES